MKTDCLTSHKPLRLETIIYIGLWALAFTLFLLDIMRVRSYTDQSLLDWGSVGHVCYNMLPFLILFAVNNYLLIPRFLKRGKYLSYILTAALAITVVWLWQCGRFISFIEQYGEGRQPRPHHDGPHPLLPLPLFLDVIYDILIVGVNLAISMIFQNFKARLEQEKLMKEKVENQLTYLKAQINPHFYMNMLNNIHGMIEIDTDKAQNMVIEMSRLMRYMLYDSSKPGIELSSEIRFIKDYLGIMRVRYPDDTVSISVKLPEEDETRGILVPPLLFLVFIENAFKHGISYTGSFVSVILSVKEGNISFSCMNSIHKTENNAAGKPESNPVNDKKSGIGLKNVRRRMDIIYGDRYSLDIEQQENIYTVNLTIPPMKLRTLIIDDEPIALEKLRNYVGKVPFLELTAACRNGLEATSVVTSEEIDVIFTDINMPDMSGMEFVNSLTCPPLIVFITAYADYAVESYRFSAVDYLLKPYGFADFQRAANKVFELYRLRYSRTQSVNTSTPSETSAESFSGEGGGSLFVKVDYRYIRVELDDIRYIKGYGEYLQIFLRGSASPLLTLSSFSAIKDRLSPDFIQVHRSYIVNMRLVESINKGRIIMDKDTDIPVGDSYRHTFLEYLSTRAVGTSQKK